ncbi:MAG: malto-oligosyltrehalose trehalohydrolase [Pararhizobium sp.]
MTGPATGTWGARLLPDGKTIFGIWAPGEETMGLRLAGRDHRMEPRADGWFSLEVSDAEPGMDYLFVRGDGMAFPDPASRRQRDDVGGPSLLCDPGSYVWTTEDWRGRPWEEAVLYELHVGTFTPEGTFRAAIDRLDHLAHLGVTAIEIMPVAQFAGRRGWGYDGVCLYAPHNAYGAPDDLKALVDAAHAKGLMVLLDVVYNHFGPEGNYLGAYAPDFFHPERHTPWGAAIAYEKPAVRAFIIENALYWLKEFRLDGLRLDAIDHIRDEESEEEILVSLAKRIRAEITDRPVHLTTEDNRNITALHERDDGSIPLYTAEWNDDLHNVAHAIATGESDAYYADFAEDHWRKLGRALAEGFAYQGEKTHEGEPRGKPSAHLPPTAFVDFLQNHDQVGNRAFGERLIDLAGGGTVRALTAMLLLSPHIPLLFMGEEWGETRPFAFFTDFHGELADAVREGRRKEFARFAAFRDETRRAAIPDPNAPATFEASKLDWQKAESEDGKDWLDFYRGLLATRREAILPHLAGALANCGKVVAVDDGLVAVDWRLSGATLRLRGNLARQSRRCEAPAGRLISATPASAAEAFSADGVVPPCSVLVFVDEPGEAP